MIEKKGFLRREKKSCLWPRRCCKRQRSATNIDEKDPRNKAFFRVCNRAMKKSSRVGDLHGLHHASTCLRQSKEKTGQWVLRKHLARTEKRVDDCGAGGNTAATAESVRALADEVGEGPEAK